MGRSKLLDPIPFRSATELVWVAEEVTVWVHELGMAVDAVFLHAQDCPCVLSLGKLVNEGGFDWIWKLQGIPYLPKEDINILLHQERCTISVHNYTQGQATRIGIKRGTRDSGGGRLPSLL